MKRLPNEEYHNWLRVEILRGWQWWRHVTTFRVKETKRRNITRPSRVQIKFTREQLCHMKMQTCPPPTLSITDPWPPAGASHWLTSMGSQEIREQGCAFHGSSFLVTEQGQEEKEERRGTEDNQDGASDQTKETGRAGSLSDILRCWGGADQALVSVYRLGLYWGPSPGGRSCECRRTKPQEAFYRKKKNYPLLL